MTHASAIATPVPFGDAYSNALFAGEEAESTWQPPSGPPPPEVVIAGRRLQPTPVFDTYWRFAAARQDIYEARQRRTAGPWTTDPILQRHRFTNCYRAADRVSQYLIKKVSYAGPQAPEEVVFRTLLFKMFNRISTWQLLTHELGGTPSWASYSFNNY